jgi:hypothetical protein
VTAAASVHVRTALGDKAFDEASSRGPRQERIATSDPGTGSRDYRFAGQRVTHAVRADMFPNDIAA